MTPRSCLPSSASTANRRGCHGSTILKPRAPRATIAPAVDPVRIAVRRAGLGRLMQDTEKSATGSGCNRSSKRPRLSGAGGRHRLRGLSARASWAAPHRPPASRQRHDIPRPRSRMSKAPRTRFTFVGSTICQRLYAGGGHGERSSGDLPCHARSSQQAKSGGNKKGRPTALLPSALGEASLPVI